MRDVLRILKAATPLVSATVSAWAIHLEEKARAQAEAAARAADCEERALLASFYRKYVDSMDPEIRARYEAIVDPSEETP